MIANKANKQAKKGKGAKHKLGAKGDYLNHEKHQEGLDPKRKVRSPKDSREFGDLAIWDVYHGMHHIGSSLLPSRLVNTLDPNSHP